jgi:RecB family exonuclease
VPVEVAGDDVPLVQDPAVQPLLDALRAVLNLDNRDTDHVDHVDPGRAEALLAGPLGGLDAGEVRRLGRQLRVREKERAHQAGSSPRTSRELLRLAVVEPSFLEGLSGPEAARARALHDLLAGARAALDAGATAEDVLWALWSGTAWPQRLRRAVAAGGGSARRANRDLDSLVALFDAAARAEEQRDHVGVRNFLATLVAQQIPADTLSERGVRGAAVRLLTAHRSKGLEWRLVVVAHVQAEAWPDLRRRSTLLQADRIGEGGLVPPVTPRELLLEERRLFYVACTRARQRLVVTAVASGEDDGEQPSRFLAELGVDMGHVRGRPVRPLSLAGLVSELRRTVSDPATSPALREAAARRLARLARESAGPRQLVPQADPASWWGTRSLSRSHVPVREPDRPVPISASLLEAVTTCPAQWFLREEAGGVERAHQSANVGQIVHALAERVAGGELTSGPDDVEELMQHVDEVWGRLHFRTPWSRAREYDRVRRALSRFLEWHHSDKRELVAVESRFTTTVELAGGEEVELIGYADRVERDPDGNVVVVDLKTSRTMPTQAAAERHQQLALYQYAVDSGALDETIGRGEAVRSGGAELVQLGHLDDGPAVVQRQPATSDDDPLRAGLREELRQAADVIRSEVFPAVPGQVQCRGCAFVSICPTKSAGSVLQQ